MKIHVTLDDSAARLPLAIRSSEGVFDRAADLRNSPSVHLVELTTQHMLGTSFTLMDELVSYFDHGQPSEADPYALAVCYANRTALEDLLRDLSHLGSDLAALHQVERLFPAWFKTDIQFLLALTAVGYPAFGYVRTYWDSEGETYHGMVVNLAQCRPHVEALTGEFSLSRLVDMIRYGFFNHEGFLLAYNEFCQAVDRHLDTLAGRFKETLMSRGIAWYLSYRHDLAFYDEALGLDAARLPDYVAYCNTMLADTGRRRAIDNTLFESWLQQHAAHQPVARCVDVVGYFAARAIAADQGDAGLRQAVEHGPDRFLALYNALDFPPLH